MNSLTSQERPGKCLRPPRQLQRHRIHGAVERVETWRLCDDHLHHRLRTAPDRLSAAILPRLPTWTTCGFCRYEYYTFRRQELFNLTSQVAVSDGSASSC